MTWKSQNIVLGYLPTGEVVLFLVRCTARGELRYTPLAKASAVPLATPAIA